MVVVAVYHAHMSASPSARAFYGLRPAMVARLLELRASLDPSLARGDEATARAQIEAVLDDFGDYIATGDLPTHRAFLAAFVAKRAAEESGASAALSTLVAIGDTAAQVVQERLLTGAGEELALLVARVTAGSVRIVNELIAEELFRRKALAHELRTGQKSERRPARAEVTTEPSPWVMSRGRRGGGGEGSSFDDRRSLVTVPVPEDELEGPTFDERRHQSTVRVEQELGAELATELATELSSALPAHDGSPQELPE